MSDISTTLSWRSLPKALLKNPLVRVIVMLAVLIELYDTTALPAFTATQQARSTKAVAENAVLRQRAEADLAQQKAINEGEVAKNAARKQRAEARKMTAIASKTRYDAAIATAISGYAGMQAKFAAKAQEAQADLTRQGEQIQNELNAYVERRKKAEADMAEIEAEAQNINNDLARCGPRGCG
jgi:hypothetical protein